MEESSNFNDIVAKPLTEQTKEDWFEWVKNYLISQDLWEVTSRSSRQERESVKDPWRRKNAAALHVIRISCGPHNLHFIRGASEAKVAWDILYRTYGSPPPPRPPPPPPLRPPPPPRIVKGIKDTKMGILYKAISDNNWPDAEKFINRYRIVLEVEFGASRDETPLHVAAKFGHMRIVEELVKLVEPKYLEIYDAFGDTPLIIAIQHRGVIPMAKCLIEKNPKALEIPSRRDKREIPVLLAFQACLKEMGRYLYSCTPPRLFRGNRNLGTSVLTTCLATGELDIVLNLLQQCEELLFAVDFRNFSTIEIIAFLLPDPLDKSQLPFWKRWVYNCYDYIKTPSTTTTGRYQGGENNKAHQDIKIPSTTTTEHFYADVQQDVENNKGHQGLGLFHRLISSINNLSGMKEICKMKQQQAQAAEILNLVCENVMFLNEDKKAKTADALIAAARADKIEFLLRVTKANAELVSLVTFPQRKGHVFFDAVRDRRAKIFNLLCGFRFKHVVTTMTEHNLNNLLYAAASLAPPSYLNNICGAALQMQREFQWFKAAESMVDPGHGNFVNDEWLNPLDFFKENHKELR